MSRSVSPKSLPMNTPPPAPQTTRAGFILLDQLAYLIAYPADAYLHWRAGRRYRTMLSLPVALGWFLASKVVVGFFMVFSRHDPEPVFSPGPPWGIDIHWLDLIVLGALVLTIWHLSELYSRSGKGEE